MLIGLARDTAHTANNNGEVGGKVAPVALSGKIIRHTEAVHAKQYEDSGIQRGHCTHGFSGQGVQHAVHTDCPGTNMCRQGLCCKVTMLPAPSMLQHRGC